MAYDTPRHQIEKSSPHRKPCTLLLFPGNIDQGTEIAKIHTYTDEQQQWLREKRPVLQCGQLADQFNSLFNTRIHKKALLAYCKRHGIKAGGTGRFYPGHVPFNKGKSGGAPVSPGTTFKKGNLPISTKPVGSELIRDDGYLWVKVAHPKTWRQKHVWLWEAINGPRPKGHVIIFLDGDTSNFDPANLACVSRPELLKMNMNGYRKQPDSLKPVVLTLSKLQAKCAIKPDMMTS